MKRSAVLVGIAFFLILTTIPFGTTAFANSDRIYNPDNGHWYQRFDKPTMTWHEARAYCESLGGYLATITTEVEDDFVYANLAADSPNVHPWLGGYQLNKTDEPAGNWEWVTGETWDYVNFFGWPNSWGEPNDCAGIEDYLVYFTPWDEDITGGTARVSFWNDLGEGENGGCGCGTCAGEWYHMSTICEWDSKLIEICHKPGTPRERTLSVAPSAVKELLKRGDHLGACSP